MRNSIKFIKLLLILIFSVISAYSQTLNLNLDEAINLALENNREILTADLDVKKANAAVREAYGYALPSVDFSASFTHFLQKPVMFFPDFEALLGNSVYGILFNEKLLPRDNSKFKSMQFTKQSFALANSFSTKAQVSQILFNSTVLEGIGASSIYLQLAKENVFNKASQTILNVKKAFYGALLTKEMAAIMEASLINAQNNLNNIKALKKQGIISEYDSLQVEVMVENLKPLVLQLNNAYKTSLDALKLAIGIDPKTEIVINGMIEYNEQQINDIENLIQTAYKNNLTLKTLELKKKVDEAFVNVERSSLYPSLYAFGSFEFAGSSDKLNFDTYNSSVVGIGLSINLFQGNRTNQKIEQSKVTVNQTEMTINSMKDVISFQLRTTYNDLNRIKTLIESQKSNVALADKAYQISLVRYKEGTGTQLEIQNSELALRQAKTNLLQSLYDYNIAMIEIDNLIGNVNKAYLTKFESKWKNY
ncbi:MAG: TolC family protein [Candidatus Kapabacteria bacterium]|nr:TolC family protein [Candidatus Kapabacteria bacterium]